MTENAPAPRALRNPFGELTTRTRWLLTAVMAALTVLVVSALVISAWADHVLLDEDRFSARIASTPTQVPHGLP